MLYVIFSNQIYVLYLFIIMLISATVKHYSMLDILVRKIRKIKDARIVVLIVSFISGILPIPGRVILSAGILEMVANKTNRIKFGVIDYLSTHHYYLWSPIEKSIIVPMAMLGITYGTMMSIIWPITLVSILVPIIYIYFNIEKDDVIGEIEEPKQSISSYINYGLLAILSLVIVFGNIIKIYSPEIIGFLYSLGLTMDTFIGFSIISITAFIVSFLLGSSGKYSGIVGTLSLIYGIEYLLWFLAIEYIGYIISPAHKCLIIGKEYFGTPLKDYYLAIALLVIPIFVIALVLTL